MKTLNVFAGKTPAEFLEKYIAHEKLELMAGAMFGLVDLEIPLPEWVKNASRQYWKNYLSKGPLKPNESAQDLGVVFVMVEHFAKGRFIEPKPIKPPSKFEKFLAGIAKKVVRLLSEKILPPLSNSEKQQFYEGCVRAEKIIERMKNPDYLKMVKLAGLYLYVAAAWRLMEKHPTRGAMIKFLREKNAVNFTVTDREIYQAFDVIGLLGATGGGIIAPEA